MMFLKQQHITASKFFLESYSFYLARIMPLCAVKNKETFQGVSDEYLEKWWKDQSFCQILNILCQVFDT
jgi:hypothetical protein